TAPYGPVTASNLRSDDAPPCFDGHDCRLAAASPAIGYHVSPRGKPRPQSPSRWTPTPLHRYRAPATCGAIIPPYGVRGRMIFMRRLLACMGMTHAGSRACHAADAGVIVVQRIQGEPDELHDVRMVWE